MMWITWRGNIGQRRDGDHAAKQAEFTALEAQIGRARGSDSRHPGAPSGEGPGSAYGGLAKTMTISVTRSRVWRRASFAGLLAAAVVLTGAGCSGSGASSGTAPPADSAVAAGQGEDFAAGADAVRAGGAAPRSDDVRTLDGARLSTADLKARLLVVNV